MLHSLLTHLARRNILSHLAIERSYFHGNRTKQLLGSTMEGELTMFYLRNTSIPHYPDAPLITVCSDGEKRLELSVSM